MDTSSCAGAPPNRDPRLVLARAAVGGVAFAILLPGVALGHQLNAAYTSRLPLAVYLAGAAITVALSFAFVILRDVRVELPAEEGPSGLPPAWLRYGLRAIGLFGWAWIMAQGIAGGSSSANVATLFLWVYGWVGVALVSALLFPIWHWIDPFSTLYDIGAWVVRRLGITPWEPSEYPERLAQWPAAIGFAFFIWLELALNQGEPSTLFIVLAGYTALTLAMMAQFGRDEWRSRAETFTVWFRLLGRLAPLALADEDGRVRRRSFAAGLLEANWSVAEVTIIALGVGSILFDGLSQTQIFYDLFGFPAIPEKTVLLFAWLGIVVGAALVLVRLLGPNPSGAGLLPIAVGYLIAHYLTYLLISGQLIVVAVSDPFQRGWNIFGTLFFEPSRDPAAAGPRVDAPARGRGRGPYGRSLGRPCGRGRHDAARDADSNDSPAATAAGRRDGGPHHADPVVARPGPRGHADRDTNRRRAVDGQISAGVIEGTNSGPTPSPSIIRVDIWPQTPLESG